MLTSNIAKYNLDVFALRSSASKYIFSIFLFIKRYFYILDSNYFIPFIQKEISTNNPVILRWLSDIYTVYNFLHNK